MAIRNWWLKLEVDGKKTRVETGPRSKDGGFCLTILQRDEGSVKEAACVIRGVAHDDGTLSLYLENGDMSTTILETLR